MDQTLIPNYSQFKSDKSNRDWTIVSRSQAASKSKPKAKLHPVYMSEDDVNRLLRSGYITFGQGKLRYREPSWKNTIEDASSNDNSRNSM